MLLVELGDSTCRILNAGLPFSLPYFDCELLNLRLQVCKLLLEPLNLLAKRLQRSCRFRFRLSVRAVRIRVGTGVAAVIIHFTVCDPAPGGFERVSRTVYPNLT
jgi:hypothetical protein